MTQALPCWFCGAPAERRAPLQPLLRGGRGKGANRVPACRLCEVRKGVATAGEFREIVRRTLEWNGIPMATFLFAGEGGPGFQWPNPAGVPGRPRKRMANSGMTCRCGRWIRADRLAGHLSRCGR